ncbi:methionine import ATP-binding protein MetN [Philodulcilactobacillus myokoensis]|uniref:Methionine import ATP-binding protein MetN n=1 Tax=Philodulcilactobacillus myokoensis TaxID=2929573 RepID=A0A9W6ETY4_9LACO|nr:ATP-binding cassette domain-containing protein [Philodulcilactobacillus myokoensis]GLB47498.1 methionine import ATP-binding protein MetN [Philodulcilactobacillus myokoensis]
MSLIDLQHVNKRFELDDQKSQVVLKDIDLSIQSGEIFGIIGYSGAGKSTLIRCINGIEKPTKGLVKFDGNIVNHFDNPKLLALRRKIGVIFQQFNLMPSRTIFDNVALPIKYNHLNSKVVQSKVLAALKQVGLSDKAKEYPAALSGGQKQRVAIARALINDPKVILCDEATSALDPKTTKSILKLLKCLNREKGITLVVVTHEMDVVENLCDRVAVLDGGKIVEQGDVYSIFAKPQSKLTREFVNTTSKLSVSKSLLKAVALKPSQRLIKLTFIDGTTAEPEISIISRRFQVNASIILSDIKLIQSKLLGGLIIILSGEHQNVSDAIKYLNSHKKIEVEVFNNAQQIIS